MRLLELVDKQNSLKQLAGARAIPENDDQTILDINYLGRPAHPNGFAPIADGMVEDAKGEYVEIIIFGDVMGNVLQLEFAKPYDDPIRLPLRLETLKIA